MWRLGRAWDDEAALGRRWREAAPFPHLVLSDVLVRDPVEVAAAFPPSGWPRWGTLQDGYQVGKSFAQDIEAMPPLLRGLIHELSAQRFLTWLEYVKCFAKLIPDPYLSGAGLHLYQPGRLPH